MIVLYIYTNTITSLEYINNYDKYIRNNKQNNDCNQIKYEEEFTNCESTICNPEDSIINCIFYNISNCKYDFIKFIDSKDNKLVLYIVPHNGLNQEEKNRQFEISIQEIEKKICTLKNKTIKIKGQRLISDLINRLSYMNLKWERSRQIEVTDIYKNL